MFVNYFTLTMPTGIYEIAMNEISKEFDKNIPKSLPFNKGYLYFTTHIFCVDANINIEEICKKYNYEIEKLYKIQIEDYMYNNNYKININYNKNEHPFYLELE